MSRLEKIGTIYSRLTALLDAGVVRTEFRPIWLDVYEAFPPRLEPRWDRLPEGSDEPLPKILYREDEARAQFYRQFGDRGEAVDLRTSAEGGGWQGKLISQKFVEKFTSVAEGKDFRADFVSAVDAMELEGVALRQADPDAALKVDSGWAAMMREAEAEGKGRRVRREQRTEETEEKETIIPKVHFKDLFAEEETPDKSEK